MRYGPDFDLGRLPPEGREILEVLIARELTSPSRAVSHRYGGLYGMAPDDPMVMEAAQRTACYPEGSMMASLRADCIHATFGVLEYIAKRGGLRPRRTDEILRAQGYARQ